MFGLVKDIIKPERKKVALLLRKAIRLIATFLFVGPFQFLLDVCKPSKNYTRPWLLAFLGLLLSISMLVSYSNLFHSWQVEGLKWLYVNSRLVLVWHPDKLDFLKYPFKAKWVGHLLLILISLGLTSKVWSKIKQKGNIVIDEGLKNFSTWTTEAINENSKAVSIAVNTPLLHIFHDNPKSEDLSEYFGKDSTFEKHFCEPFLEGLRKCKDNGFEALRFLYLCPDVLKDKAKWFPASDESNFNKYNNSIEQFRNDVVRACTRGATTNDAISTKAKEMFRETYMLPMSIAVIKGKPTHGRAADTLVLALTDEEDLKQKPGNTASNSDKKEFAEKVAGKVRCLKCIDPEVVRFFDKVFNDLWNDTTGIREAILALLRQSRNGDIEILLRQDYDAYSHKSFKPDKPAHILYSTTK